MIAIPGPHPSDLRQRIEQLVGLPIRQATVRSFLLSRTPDQDSPPADGSSGSPKFEAGHDPGWALLALGFPTPRQIVQRISRTPWWPALSEPARGAVEQLWRHSVAVSIEAKRLSRLTSIGQPEHWARIGLLANLGLWSIAAVAPEVLAKLLTIDEPNDRLAYLSQNHDLDLTELGLRQADRWGNSPELVDAAWLHAGQLAKSGGCPRDPDGFRLIERAYQTAEQTPWQLGFGPRPTTTTDLADLKRLTAEVQAQTVEGLPCLEDRDEGRLLRSHLQLIQQADHSERERRAYAQTIDELTSELPDFDQEAPASEGLEINSTTGASRSDQQRRQRLQRAWRILKSDQENQRGHLLSILRASRRSEERPERDPRRELLRSLAEFAAGAGHELNNPLAVILGRAQLLLARTNEPEAKRSLRAIIGQSQRAHRILRDLMYVARPPAPRLRPCQPMEIGRLVLRELIDEAESRGIRLNFEAETQNVDSLSLAWTDPEALRHLVEVLARNAIEATPSGQSIRVKAAEETDRITWQFQNPGRKLNDEEVRHLLDPFYCGRSAGRGLGLGLPRLARFLENVGGELRWETSEDGISTFRATVPIAQSPVEEKDT